MIARQLKTYQKWILGGLFLTFISIGISLSDDYGIAWDEPSQMEIGRFNYEYLTGESDTLTTYHDRFYGAAYEMPLYAMQKWINFENTSDIFIFRHLITHLVFIISLAFFFALLYRLFNNYQAAILGVLMLYLHPRIFAHSFFNSKDIVFMSVFIVGLYTLYLLYEKQSTKRIIFHALTSALLIDIRVLGIVLPFISLLVVFPKIIETNQWRKTLQTISIYGILVIMFVYLFWPATWTDFLLIGRSFSKMSHFPFLYEILFRGSFIDANTIPWNYLPSWILISTPPFILLLSSLGFIWLTINYFKNPEKAFSSNHTWFILVLASFPIDFIIILIFLNSSLYDAWRQVFFLYPLILISAVFAFVHIMNKLKNKTFQKRVLQFFIAVFIVLTIKKIYQLHPYEQVYFNHFVSKKDENRRKSFEMDYWGLSYRQGLEYIVQSDSSEYIKVYFANAAGPNNMLFLPKSEQKRIVIVDNKNKADYFITNYRYHPDNYQYKNEVYTIERDQNRILSVFKLK